MLLAKASRSTMVTGRLATASSRRSVGRRLFLASTTAYSSTSAIVVSAVSISSTAVLPRINPARPPSTAASRTLASAASFTTALPPTLKIRQHFLFRNSPALDLPCNLARQHGKQLVLELSRQGILLQGEEHTRKPSPPRHQNRVLGPQHPRGFVAKLPHRADLHVVTRVTIIRVAWPCDRPFVSPPCRRCYTFLRVPRPSLLGRGFFLSA